MIEDLKEKCGIFGIYGPHMEAARTIFYGLFALQHRGQEGAGIAVSDGKEFHAYKGVGLISQIFTEHDMENMHGHIGIGHNRYSTSRGAHSVDLDLVQPFV